MRVMAPSRKTVKSSVRGADATKGQLAKVLQKAGPSSTLITHASTQHLLHRAGVVTASESTDLPIQGFVHMKMWKLLKKAVIAMEYEKRSTLQKKDIKKAADIMGLALFATPTKEPGAKGSIFLSCRQKGSSSVGKASQTNVQEVRAQKKADCLIIPKERFATIVRELVAKLQSVKEQVRLREDALDTLQVAVEALTVRLLEKAHVVALSAGRRRVFAQDIETAFLLSH